MVKIFEKSTLCNVVFASAISVIAECLLSLLRGYSCVLSGIVLFIFYSAFIFYVGYKGKRAKLYATVFVSTILIIQVPARLLWWTDSLISLPEGIMHLLGILCGLLLLKCGVKTKIAIVSAMIVLCFMFNRIYVHWIQYISYGNMNGIVSEQIQNIPHIEDVDGTVVKIEEMKDVYTVIDCCYTGCGVCIGKLPMIQRLYNKYIWNDKVKVFVLFFKLKNESNNGIFKWLSELSETIGDCSFPILYGDFDELSTTFKIDRFPTVILLNPDGKRVFRGSIQLAENYLERVTRHTAKTYLKYCSRSTYFF